MTVDGRITPSTDDQFRIMSSLIIPGACLVFFGADTGRLITTTCSVDVENALVAHPKWQLPEHFIFVPELPHTSTGKLLKSELRRLYKDGTWRVSA